MSRHENAEPVKVAAEPQAQRAVRRTTNVAVVQRDLQVGPANDAFEQEADRMSAQVLQRLHDQADADPASRRVKAATSGPRMSLAAEPNTLVPFQPAASRDPGISRVMADDGISDIQRASLTMKPDPNVRPAVDAGGWETDQVKGWSRSNVRATTHPSFTAKHLRADVTEATARAALVARPGIPANTVYKKADFETALAAMNTDSIARKGYLIKGTAKEIKLEVSDIPNRVATRARDGSITVSAEVTVGARELLGNFDSKGNIEIFHG